MEPLTGGTTQTGGTTSTGGTAGSTSTGGTTNTGGTGGTGGVKFINSGPCPDNPPTLGASCSTAAICCYAAGAAPYVCTASTVSLDGGSNLDASRPLICAVRTG